MFHSNLTRLTGTLHEDQFDVCVTVHHFSKVKSVPVKGPVAAQRVSRGIALLFTTAALEGGEWSAAHPGRTLPRE